MQDAQAVKEAVELRRTQETLQLERAVARRRHARPTKRRAGAPKQDPKILAALDAAALAATADDAAWAKAGKALLQNPGDVTVWEAHLPPHLQALPSLWRRMGKEHVECEAGYASLNAAAAPRVKELTRRAYEMAYSGGSGRLSGEDRLRLDRHIAASCKDAYAAAASTETEELAAMEREVDRLFKAIAQVKGERRRRRARRVKGTEGGGAAPGCDPTQAWDGKAPLLATMERLMGELDDLTGLDELPAL